MLLRDIQEFKLPHLESPDLPDPETFHGSVATLMRGVVWSDDPQGSLFENRVTLERSDFGGARFGARFKAGSWVPDGLVSPHFTEGTHFKDLQFMHSMASSKGERPQDTRERILRLVRFYVDVATGRISHKTKIKDTSFGNEVFPGNDDRTVAEVLGAYDAPSTAIRRRAAGALLHLVQDSYSAGHTVRDSEGRIEQFQEYSAQDHDKHAASDELMPGATLEDRIAATPGAAPSIEMGSRLLKAIDRRESTENIVDYARDMVFPISENARESGSSPEFKH